MSDHWQPGYAPPPAQPPGYGYGPAYYKAPSTDGLAITALVLAIAAWLCLPVLSLVALPLAASAKKRIDSSDGQLVGQNLIGPARVIAFVNMAVWAIVLLFVFAAAVIDVASAPG